jgi:hypothetical protein
METMGRLFVRQKTGPLLWSTVLLSLCATSAQAKFFGGVEFPAGNASFVDVVVSFAPDFGGAPPAVVFQDAKNALGLPGVVTSVGLSLGDGGRITLRFVDNSLTGSGDSTADLWVFEIGPAMETTFVDISKDGRTWHAVGSVPGGTSGIDIDAFGFGTADQFSFVRLTDEDEGAFPGPEFHLGNVAGADIVAVGAASSGPAVRPSPRPIKSLNYTIAALRDGRDQLIITGDTLQWHHIAGAAPGGKFLTQGNSAAPTVINSTWGPPISWFPVGWPPNRNSKMPESFSTVMDELAPVLPAVEQRWRVKRIQARGDVRIVQQPNAGNGYTLIVEFDDLGPGNIPEWSGASNYVISLEGGGR